MSENRLIRPLDLNEPRRTPAKLPVSDYIFALADGIVRQSGVVSCLQRWREDDLPPGRYGSGGVVGDRAILTSWLIAAAEHLTPRYSDLAEILFDRLEPAKQTCLDILSRPESKSQRSAAVMRAVKRLLALIDPYPYGKSESYSIADAQRMLNERDTDLEALRADRLDELTRRLIATSARPAVDKSLCLIVTTAPIIVPGPRHGSAGWAHKTGEAEAGRVSDPFLAPLSSLAPHTEGRRPRWGWIVDLAVPYPSPGVPKKVPLIVAGATLQRPGQKQADSILALIESARLAGVKHVPPRTTADCSTIQNRSETTHGPHGIPGPPRTRANDYDGQRRSHAVYARAVDANVLGDLHHKSRGLAHTQLALTIHLAAANARAIDGRNFDEGWYSPPRGNAGLRPVSVGARYTSPVPRGSEVTR